MIREIQIKNYQGILIVIVMTLFALGLLFGIVTIANANHNYTFPIAKKDCVILNNRVWISSWYSYRRVDYHGRRYKAWNIPAVQGAEVLALDDGTVIDTGWGKRAGIFIKIMNDDGISYTVCHLDRWNVIQNQKVRGGDVLGYVGKSGRATGNHLRIQMFDGDKIISPYQFWKDKMKFRFKSNGGVGLYELS